MTTPSATVRLADIVARAVAEERPDDVVVLLPLGSHEDHGPHVPMGDYILADMIAERIAKLTSERGVRSFAAPCLPFGVADYFGSSPGGLALAPATFRAVLRDLISCLSRHGLKKIVILNGHGGNVPVIHDVTLQFRLETGIIIPSLYLWKLARHFMERRMDPAVTEQFRHGAEPMLSLTKALRPQHIIVGATEQLLCPVMMGMPVSGFGTLDFRGLPIDVPVEFDQVPNIATTGSGPVGDEKLGNLVAEDLIDYASGFVVHFHSATKSANVTKSRKSGSEANRSA